MNGWIGLEDLGPEISLWPLVLMGAAVGIVSGMFGVGGGFLLTPLLGVVMKIPMPIAVGTGLCMMVGSSAVAWLKYRELGHGEPRFALLMIPGSLLGVGAGSRIIAALDRIGAVTIAGREVAAANFVLLSVYIVFLVSIATVMWLQSRGDFDVLEFVRRGPLVKLPIGPYIDLPSLPMSHVSAMGISYAGLLLGLLSGLLGIGGGIVLVPILLYGYGFPFRHAAGTGIAVTLLTAVFGTVLHANAARVSLPLALVLLTGAGVGARLGVQLTRSLSVRTLRRGLTVLILMTAVLIAGTLARPWYAS